MDQTQRAIGFQYIEVGMDFKKYFEDLGDDVDKISKANKELEEKISVRTAELYTQKEELKKQKDELEKTNEKLSKAHEIINDQNIKDYNNIEKAKTPIE